MNRGPQNIRLNEKQDRLPLKDGLKFVSPFLKKYRFAIILTLVFLVIGTILALIGPTMLSELSKLINREEGFELRSVERIGITLIFIYAGSGIANYIGEFILTGATQRMAYDLREQISKKINRLPLSYFDSQQFGDILSRVTNDVDTISTSITMVIRQLLTSIIMVFGILIVLTIHSWIIMLISLLSLPLVMIIMLFIAKKTQKYFVTLQRTLGGLNGHIEEAFSGHRIIKSFNREEYNSVIFDKYNDELEKTAWKSQFLSSLSFPVLFFLGNIRYVLVITIGAALGFDAGSILLFIIFTRQINMPIDQLAQMTNVIQSCLAASGRVREFLQEEELSAQVIKTVLPKEKIKGDVEFINVNFGYEKNRLVIKDFTSSIKAGSKIAIVGPTGAGKTTLVNLLMRFYETTSGEITIDGVSTKDISRENVATLFGMVLQDTWLFEGTIKENLKYGKSSATDQEIFDACEACHINYFIQALPGGYDFVIDENANLSAGQQQLLTIVRAMIENAPMLILDEATSSVDTRTEILIQRAMEKLTKNRTSFVIAHRLSTIINSDRILVMRDGNIVEQGNHTELMELNGFYSELYNSQFTSE